VKEWEKDKLFFIKMGMTEEQLAAFKEFLVKNEDKKWNYKTASTNFSDLMAPESAQATEKLKGMELVDLENALKAGKETGRNILIQFTGHACVNSRKMEDNILTDPEVNALISKNFEYFSAYCDDRRPDPANNSLTIGKKYCKIQSEKFKSSSQPTFYILEPNGKIIAETMYTPSIEEFKNFLNKGLK
jgi:thioredoxin-related protein